MSAFESMTDCRLDDTAAALLAQCGLALVSCAPMQSLWAGYGHICAVQAVSSGGMPVSLVLKSIAAPPAEAGADEGHRRKMLSYHVERHFYARLAPALPPSVAVARCLAASHDEATGASALLLRDLRVAWPSGLRLASPASEATEEGEEDEDEAEEAKGAAFPLALEKRGVLSRPLVHAALDWLAGFHGYFWGRAAALDRAALVRPPLEHPRGEAVEGVWLNGGYTYLATRRSEHASLAAGGSEWKAALCRGVADEVAAFLAPAPGGPAGPYETLIHGDVKSENMFGSAAAAAPVVAFFDFQYVGLGLGVCDLAKLFTCSVPLDLLVGDGRVPEALDMQPGERALLEHYVRRLEAVASKSYPWHIFARHWEAALVDWLRFQAGWGFWGNTEWLKARVRCILRRRPSPWRETEK